MRYIIKIVHLISYRILPMRPFTLITFTLLFVMLSPAAAQEPDPAPWPPADPQSLFGPDVEIISTEMGSSLFNQGSFYSDDENRILYIDRWGAYPFPNSLVKLSGLRQLPNNRYFIGDKITNDGEMRWWLLDLESASWLQLQDETLQVQTSCGSIPFREDQPSYVTGWVTISGSNRQAHLCNLETGYRTPPLPDGYVEWSWKVIRRDASDEFLFYTARRIDTDPKASVLFVQNLRTQEARELMAFRRDSSPYAKEPVISRLGETDYFVFDYPVPTSRDDPNRKQTALINLNQMTVIPIASNPVFEDNPVRLIYREKTTTEDATQCEVRWLDLQAVQWRTYTVSSNCWFEWYGDDESYYRAISADRTTARLMAVNELTGASRVVYEGEIEHILGLYTNERYLALVMDSSGRIDNVPKVYPDIEWSLGYEMWLIDLTTMRVLLKTPAENCGSAGPLWCPGINQFTDDLITLRSYDDSTTTDLFSFSQQRQIISSIRGILGDLVTGDWAYVSGNRQSKSGNRDLYNITTMQQVDLVALPSADYWLGEVTYVGESRFDITIGYDVEWMGRGENPLYNIITYRVRVNAPGLE